MDALSPADLLVALKLAVAPEHAGTVRALGTELGMSKSAVANALRKLEAAGVVRASARRVDKLALRELLVGAVRWLAPAVPGEVVLGLPTAHSVDVLARHFIGDPDPVVMPLEEGPLRGRAVEPLHPLAPAAAARDPELHRLLAVVDMLRIGGARDRQVAARELRSWL